MEKIVPYALLGMTAVTGLVDAVSFLSLGHVFTANMTGNVVLLGFAIARVPGLSVERSLTALFSFLVGAIVGGRIMARSTSDSQIRFATLAFGLEIIFLLAATLCGIGFRSDLSHDFRPFALIAFTALAMGARNAAVRKLAIPDLTTTVLTLTLTGLAADSSFAGGSNPRWARRAGSVIVMFAGALAGAFLIRYSVSAALGLAAAISAACCVMLFRSLPSSAAL